jgi:hypothetical protein
VFETSSFPHFLGNQLRGCEYVSLARRPHFIPSPGRFIVLISFRALVNIGAILQLEALGKLGKISVSIRGYSFLRDFQRML